MASMITGMWSGINFYCSEHPDEKFELKQGLYSVYYGCVHEYDDENPCHNRLNLLDAEKAIQHVMDVINEATFGGVEINLTNYKWTKNGITFTVLKHNPINDEFDILVENKKIMQNRPS